MPGKSEANIEKAKNAMSDLSNSIKFKDNWILELQGRMEGTVKEAEKLFNEQKKDVKYFEDESKRYFEAHRVDVYVNT